MNSGMKSNCHANGKQTYTQITSPGEWYVVNSMVEYDMTGTLQGAPLSSIADVFIRVKWYFA